ncbi:hypothetical protein GCM10009630_54970 [Kribbella jejuensis]|uniref:Uncharacterized protein n=1 Tax=Kribbella jejuensis TaxID=236068 RepID=A0A542EW53_9ACTN|nr:hypothetical protein [Kribbella jejuensis]TQJ19590.1 hypothetical protein FB475_3760 [Kribbella jejuensis]
MKRLTVGFWVVTVALETYGTMHAMSAKAQANGKPFWRVLFSGQEFFIWHGAPGWYYPVLIGTTVFTGALTAVYVFSREQRT